MSLNLIIIFLLLIVVSMLIVTILLLKKQQNINLNDPVFPKINKIEEGLELIDKLVKSEFKESRDERVKSFRDNREELNNTLKNQGDTLVKTVSELSNSQKNQFDLFVKQFTEFNEHQRIKHDDLIKRQEEIRKATEVKLKEIRETVETKLNKIQDDNNQKLDEMRKTVDEKLQESVEKRFNESFKLISERLDQVHKGLGEMQNLAVGVGDLKKVLTNVKTRGNLGEVQLGAILEQILSPEQYGKNAQVKENSLERVEYVVKLPGKNIAEKAVLLPIDSKFPLEDYYRLLEAYETNNEVEVIAKSFENAVKKNAKDINAKYINPPITTDFAIMFVPTEGLYAEILRRPGLFDNIQRELKVTIVGPTNLVAFLSSLQMGFRTLAIEKRSSEVWEVLGAVKTEFVKFGGVLDRVQSRLTQAAKEIDKAGVRTRAIERKLRDVQELPVEKAETLLEENISLSINEIEENE